MTRRVEFFFDVRSPAAYLAWTQLPALCAQTGAQLAYRPMLLGAVFQATGNSSPATVPAKARHSPVDFGRFARRYGVPYAANPHFPIITLTLMRAVTGVQSRHPDRLESLLSMLFRAIWVDSLNLNDGQVVASVLEKGGFDPAFIEQLAADPAVKTALRDTTEEAVRRGVFGAPTFFVGDQMFFGQDRMDFVREALMQGNQKP